MKIKFFRIISAAVLTGLFFISCELLCEHEYGKGVVTNASSYPAISTETCTKCDKEEERNTKVGDTGPAGGIIFYVGSFTLFNNASDTTGTSAHYLEAAPVDQGTLAWASSSYTSTDIQGTAAAIGTGRKNTAIILAVDDAAPAALACKNYTGGGKTDWFLPSYDEIKKIIDQRSSIGNLTGLLWSSTQYSNYYARADYVTSPADISNSKSNNGVIRAIRAF